MSKQDILLGILLYFFGFTSYPIIFLLKLIFEDYIYNVAHRDKKKNENEEERQYRWE